MGLPPLDQAESIAKAAAGGEMGAEPPGQVTRLLQAWSDGGAAALEQLIPLVYAELRRLANRYMDRERPGHTAPDVGLDQRGLSASG